MSPTFRRLLVNVHLWLGLTLGLILTIVSLSGALLAASRPIAKLEMPALLFPSGIEADDAMRVPASQLDIAAWIRAAAIAYPQLEHAEVVAAPNSVPFPSSVPLLAGPMRQESGTKGERHFVVSIDPNTGETIGGVVLEETFLGNLLAFHATLTSGVVGFMLVATSGFVAIVSLGTGLYLWWPKRGGIKRALVLRTSTRGRTFLLSLHSVSAVWLFVPLAVVLVSGSYLLTPEPYESLARGVSSIREAPDGNTRAAASSCDASIGMSAAIASAQAIEPGAMLRLASEPENPCDPYVIGLTDPDTHNMKAMATQVWVDRQTGSVLASRKAGSLTSAEAVQSWMGPLHADLAGGPAGAVLVGLTGLLIPLLYFTGLLAWLRQLRARRAARAETGALTSS